MEGRGEIGSDIGVFDKELSTEEAIIDAELPGSSNCLHLSKRIVISNASPSAVR